MLLHEQAMRCNAASPIRRSGATAAIGCALALVTVTVAGGQAQFPTGTFANGSLTITFNSNGTHSVTDSGNVVVRGTYVVKGDEISLTDKDGEYACDGTGRYLWQYDGKALTLKYLLDDCGGRVDGLTNKEWIKT
jgi:hypothetical protein